MAGEISPDSGSDENAQGLEDLLRQLGVNDRYVGETVEELYSPGAYEGRGLVQWEPGDYVDAAKAYCAPDQAVASFMDSDNGPIERHNAMDAMMKAVQAMEEGDI